MQKTYSKAENKLRTLRAKRKYCQTYRRFRHVELWLRFNGAESSTRYNRKARMRFRKRAARTDIPFIRQAMISARYRGGLDNLYADTDSVRIEGTE